MIDVHIGDTLQRLPSAVLSHFDLKRIHDQNWEKRGDTFIHPMITGTKARRLSLKYAS